LAKKKKKTGRGFPEGPVPVKRGEKRALGGPGRKKFFLVHGGKEKKERNFAKSPWGQHGQKK